jgi:predicted nucleic acid-binding protein
MSFLLDTDICSAYLKNEPLVVGRVMLKGAILLEVTLPIAEKFGEVRAGLLDQGITVGEMDMLNGASALVHGLTMVTHNVQDYANIPGGAGSWRPSNLALIPWCSKGFTSPRIYTNGS